jgi:hypothetical protein
LKHQIFHLTRSALLGSAHNVDVLPPGQGRAIVVEFLELLPVGRDGLLSLRWLLENR